ncbi:MAG: hypothetical protein U9N87_04625 [Planctomycetota bacterium]|nr:hypothetical protein [Planctomycetota bacterium]
MRRTSISLAIIALLLYGQGFGQAVGIPGENIAPGVAASAPQAGQPAPEMALPEPNTNQMAPAVVPPAPSAAPQAAENSWQGQPVATYQGDSSMLQLHAAAPVEGSGVWNQAMPGGPTNASCAYPGCALCGAGTACPKDWYVDQRVRIMYRPMPRSSAFSTWHTTQSFPTASGNVTVDVYTPATTSKSLPFDLSSSYEITLGHYLGLDTHNRDHFLEFTFYGTNQWSNHGALRASADASGILEVDDTDPDNPIIERWGVFGNINGGNSVVAGFNRADFQSSEYSSWLNNYEVNLQIRPRAKADRLVLHKNGKWRRQCQEGIFCNWLAGTRLFSMGGKYNFNSSSTIEYFREENPDVPYATGHSTASYRTRTYNTLIGLQIGPDWTYRKCRASCGVGLKAGAYINFAKQESMINVAGAEQDEFSNGENIDFEGSATKNTSAATFELDFHAAYKVRPNFILKANYELMYMTGLALAPEQVDMALDQSLKLNTGGSLWFQSATLGAEYVW